MPVVCWRLRSSMLWWRFLCVSPPPRSPGPPWPAAASMSLGNVSTSLVPPLEVSSHLWEASTFWEGGTGRGRFHSCAIHIKKIGIAYLVDVRILCSSRSNLRLEVRRLFLVKVAGESLGPEVLPAGLCSPPIGRLRRANAYAMRYYENPITFVSLPVFVGGPEEPGRPPCRAATVPTEPCTSVAQTRRAPSPWSSPSRRTTSRTR